MVKFYYREALTPVSSHEASLEPTTKRREDLGKHSVYTHFPKDRNCEIYKRTKITGAPCRRRNGEAVPRAVNFGDLITTDGQGDGVPKAGLQQAAADSRGSRTCVECYHPRYRGGSAGGEG